MLGVATEEEVGSRVVVRGVAIVGTVVGAVVAVVRGLAIVGTFVVAVVAVGKLADKKGGVEAVKPALVGEGWGAIAEGGDSCRVGSHGGWLGEVGRAWGR